MAVGTLVGDLIVQGAVEVEWPVMVGVPPQPATAFQPRLSLNLWREGTVERVSAGVTRVLSGAGGTGKSQLAAGRAWGLWRAQAVDLLVWVAASSQVSVLTVYAQAYEAVTGTTPDTDVERDAGRFLAWLAGTSRRWLVALDDVADPEDLRDWWPRGPGEVIVTTQRQDAALQGAGRTVVEMEVFTPDEGLAYLTERLPEGRLIDAEALVEDLHRLPLAVAQAAAFILDQGIDCREYRRRFAAGRLDLLFGRDAAADDYRQTVTTTWSLALARADDRPPQGAASIVLRVAALLDPAGVPLTVFTTASARAHVARTLGSARSRRWFPLKRTETPVSVEDVRQALLSLRRFSLVQLDQDSDQAGDGDNGVVRVHGLVQRTMRERLEDPALAGAARAAADALQEAWPEDDYRPEVRLVAQSLRTSVDLLHAHCPGPLWQPDGHPVLWTAGRSRRRAGLVNDAVAYWQWLTQTAHERLGPSHADTLSSRSSLAAAYRDAGRLGEALPLFERTLADRERLLGPDHPDTLNSRNNLAASYQDAGRLGEALLLYERTLADRERLLGPDHPDTLTSRNNLASAYQAAGRPREALPLYERTLADRERLLGPDHPDTLSSRNNLASAYQAAGRLGEALPLYERTLADYERLLGADHPDTLTSRNNLASAYQAAGRLGDALPLFERTLRDRERVLGVDHPDTLSSRGNLAIGYLLAGRLAEALPLFERTLGGRERLLGADHLNTLISRENLASAYQAAGRLGEALLLYERTLADSERLLGPDHPDTMQIRNDLASAYHAAAQANEESQPQAVPEQEELLSSDFAANPRLTSPSGDTEGTQPASRTDPRSD